MASIDIPTAVLAVLVSVTLSPFVNLISDGLKGWGKRYIEEQDQLEDWNNSTVELAKDAKIVWQTQYEEQDTRDFGDHKTWARKVQNNIRQTKTRLRTHAQSAPPNADEITEQKLMELIASCEALNEATSGSGHEDEFRETGQRVKENAEELIDVTPRG